MSPAALQIEPDRSPTSSSHKLERLHAVENAVQQAVPEHHPPGPLQDYSSCEGKLRQQGTLRSLVASFHGVPGVVSLAAGFPPPSVFPLSGLSVRLFDGPSVDLSPDLLLAAQSYNVSLRGHPGMVQWATAHVAALHQPPATGGHGVLITNGANHTLELLTSLFLDPGDAILVEQYTYPVIVESIALPKGYRPLGVPIDGHGIIPSELRKVLEGAAAAAAAGGPPKPKLLYTIPTGQNPTGCTISPERRREVYQLCRQHDVWIVEDDPYFYLQWGAAAADLLRQNGGTKSDALTAAVPGLTGLMLPAAASSSTPPTAHAHSYLGLDVDGRVIRVDSFAKFLAPGMRLGWVTAREDVVEKLVSALQAHTVGPCSLSQAVVGATLAAWGEAGLDAHLRRLQAEYARRCAVLCCAAERELGGVAAWETPQAGMFLWIKFLHVEDSTEVWGALHDEKVIVCPGRAMHVDAGIPGQPAVKSPFVRVSFSSAAEQDLDEGMVRLGRVLREHRIAVANMPPTPNDDN